MLLSFLVRVVQTGAHDNAGLRIQVAQVPQRYRHLS